MQYVVVQLLLLFRGDTEKWALLAHSSDIIVAGYAVVFVRNDQTKFW